MSTETNAEVADTNGYGEANVQTLRDAAHIRHRPGMYIGNTDIEGMHHLVWEVVYNSVDEALAGYCKNINVTVHVDGSISIADDGRGIPVGVKSDTGKSTLEEALTIAGSSGKFDNAAYKTSAGLHGMGAKAMNALSEWCEAEVRREGRVYKMEFERGYATSALQDLGPAPKGQTGTTISFKPDPEKFGDLAFTYDRLANRFQQIAFLNKGLRLNLRDEREDKGESFHSEKGIVEYVEFLNRGEQPEHPPIYISKTVEGVAVEVCLQYTTGDNKLEMCFTNNAYNKDGGTHLSGFRAGLTRSITAYGKKENYFKDVEVRGDDFREGLTAVINISHPKPSFESQTKVKLTSPEVEGMTSSVVYESLQEYLEKNPKEARVICEKVRLTAEARIAAKKARDAVKGRRDALSGGLPGKLYDCTSRNHQSNELFLVEGDSAGGSAESGRDRHYQAILPLKGKVLNVEKAKFEKLLDNNEIAALIGATGIDIDNVEDVSKVRYGKIIILTDADVDGQHIRTLLLTFFFRQMRKLIEEGHVFVARPPLFKVTQKKETRFVQTREDMALELTGRGLKGTALRITKPGQPERVVSGEDLDSLLKGLADAETSLQNIERRGRLLKEFLGDSGNRRELPEYHVRTLKSPVDEKWLVKREQVADWLADWKAKNGREPVLGEDYAQEEWHEFRSLNRSVAKIRNADWFDLSDLVPSERVAGREPPIRFVLEHEGSTKQLATLRELVVEIRRLGEKGIAVTRFKGLGEMDPEELWATTLDPQHRSLMKVTLNDAFKAEEMFRTLMGKEVQERREFIFKNSLKSVEEIDYGA
jgi:DNA gyrase subunit B